MPRPTYRTRLEVLINNPAISARDKDFAQSLLSYYERKGRLSAGRVKWVATLEDRYSPEKLLAATEKHKTFLLRLDALGMRCEPSSWAAGYVESLISQVKGDRRLSDRQLEILRKIEAEHDDAALAERQKWIESYTNNPDLRADAIVVANYYMSTGYFKDTARDIINDDTNINIFNKNKDTPLIIACKNNHNEIIKILVNCNADLNYINNKNENALIIACINNNIEIINYLIKFGVDINCKNNMDESYLSFATLHCNLNVIKLLLQNSSNEIIKATINKNFNQNIDYGFEVSIQKLLLNYYFKNFFKQYPNSYIKYYNIKNNI